MFAPQPSKSMPAQIVKVLLQPYEPLERLEQFEQVFPYIDRE